MRGNTYSKKQSSEQISRKLSEFIKEIQYKNRNPVDNNVLKMLQEMETNPELLFDSQQYLYRSRIVHSKDKLNGEYPFFGFGKDGSFVAPSECTKDIDTLKADLKVKKAALKKVEKEVEMLEAKKAKADAKAAEDAKKAEAESVLKKLLAEGMSADEILAKLK